MELISDSKSKIAALIENNRGRLGKQVIVTVSENSPESIQLTHRLPRSSGWRFINNVPIRKNGRKDYIKFLMETSEKEVWIKVSTAGGRSKVYAR